MKEILSKGGTDVVPAGIESVATVMEVHESEVPDDENVLLSTEKVRRTHKKKKEELTVKKRSILKKNPVKKSRSTPQQPDSSSSIEEDEPDSGAKLADMDAEEYWKDIENDMTSFHGVIEDQAADIPPLCKSFPPREEFLLIALDSLSKTVNRLAEEIADLKKQVMKCKCQKNQEEIEFVKQRQTNFKGVKPSYISAAMGNGKPSMIQARKIVDGPKRIVGSPKDTIEFLAAPVAMNSSMEDQVIDITLARSLMLPPPRDPKTIQTMPIRIERTQPRRLCKEKDWREKLREKGISPFSIMFPYPTTVEILIRSEDHSKMEAFLQSINVQSSNPDPFLRRDGKAEPLSEEILTNLLQQRIRMLSREHSGVGIRYLQNIISCGVQRLTNDLTKAAILKDLASALRPIWS